MNNIQEDKIQRITGLEYLKALRAHIPQEMRNDDAHAKIVAATDTALVALIFETIKKWTNEAGVELLETSDIVTKMLPPIENPEGKNNE